MADGEPDNLKHSSKCSYDKIKEKGRPDGWTLNPLYTSFFPSLICIIFFVSLTLRRLSTPHLQDSFCGCPSADPARIALFLLCQELSGKALQPLLVHSHPWMHWKSAQVWRFTALFLMAARYTPCFSTGRTLVMLLKQRYTPCFVPTHSLYTLG